MSCHGRVAGKKLMLGQPEVNLGIIPGYGGTQRLPRLIGLDKALEVMRTDRKVFAAEACELGWATGEPVDDAIAVGVAQAVTIAVVTSFWKGAFAVAGSVREACTAAFSARVQLRARPVILGGIIVKVARHLIGTTRYFKFIACTVAISIIQAVAVTVVARLGTIALTIASSLSDPSASANTALIKRGTRTVIVCG